jgi:hypothetical protein
MNNIKQPTRLFFVNFTLPPVYELDACNKWLNEIFLINHTSDTVNQKVTSFAYSGLLLTNKLLQAANIPVFYSGYLKDVTQNPNDSCKFTANLAILQLIIKH